MCLFTEQRLFTELGQLRVPAEAAEGGEQWRNVNDVCKFVSCVCPSTYFLLIYSITGSGAAVLLFFKGFEKLFSATLCLNKAAKHLRI